MNCFERLDPRLVHCRQGSGGFTLIELLIAMVVGLLVMGTATVTYTSQKHSARVQRDLAQMQQNLRAAMYLMKNDIRNCGRDGQMTGTVGIRNITHQATVAGDPTLYPTLTLTTYVDNTGNGVADTSVPPRTISYVLRDQDNDGLYELWRSGDAGATWQMVMEGLDGIALAFAYDADSDGDLDRFNNLPNNNVIWAIDSNGDNRLDTNLDNNNDGTVDVLDDSNGDNWIDLVDGNLGAGIAVNNIRAVRIWLLARSRLRDTTFANNGPFQVGHHIFRPNTVGMERPNINDNNYAQFRRVLLEGAVALANIERIP